LGNHLSALFDAWDLAYDRSTETENNVNSDFLFSGIEEYRDSTFDASLFAMLGVKSICKNRWREVLFAAARIPQKYLITLEPAIRRSQTDEMRARGVQLVIPAVLHDAYLLQR